ncbi:armadillo repeat-containing protein 1-like [Hyla sarda]|uniref:armadillo repeat-containing protein 1-like n=1 Tax=Hyla sarda TaxID=327740 RepID=UPI0024C2C2ED|nr:armadillo repeat-containing protein 1-like [Hyla sarda]XP_056422587.1 armadillo repeat-containing protein 1-like [Hyla sarda]XP_056422589.1 armadillo repeat-containing protein 1-like [Hyla sarda]XP_056422590.1 armadillo repeat-containing protein 1-like [Hyla sarda]
MDAVSVVTHLRNLASQPQNRASIVKDKSCLAGLILFLSHQDTQVVEAALQTIHYLCDNPNHCEVIKSELGMMVSLQNIRNSALSNHVKLLAHRIYVTLSMPSHQHTPEAKNKQNSLQFFLPSANKKARIITLHIHGLDNMERKSLCEEALLKVKGVISFTFQIAKRRCTVRVKPDLATECITSAIANTKVLKAQQVIKNECGKEVYVPMPTMNNQVEKSHCLPDYLPEEESPQKDLEKALTRPVSKEETRGNWLKATVGFLSKTFYW